VIEGEPRPLLTEKTDAVLTLKFAKVKMLYSDLTLAYGLG